MTDDYSLLGLGELTSLVRNVKISAWGSELLLECIYDPTGEPLPYQLLFSDCREINWTVHDWEEVGELEADLIGIYLGKGSHQNPACIHTDIFEISIVYEKFQLTKLKLPEKQYQTTAPPT